MQLEKYKIEQLNEEGFSSHARKIALLKEEIDNIDGIIQKLVKFQIAIPSWALGTGGTRFGRFAGSGEPGTLEQKIEDVGILHALNKSSGAISLHIPWDIPKDAGHIKAVAAQHNIQFDAVNSNTFQDQKNQKHSYKFGSLHHVSADTRKQAVDHNIEVIEYGRQLGSKALTVWLADGSSFPGQLNFRKAFERTLNSLEAVYKHVPDDWKMLIEYKAFEPNFYSTTISDWGQSMMLANKLGSRAYTLVDLGHHLPNANIEQIVALLLMEEKLGGFHFNDSKYADDDLTAGSIKPYQLFLIFNELVAGMDEKGLDHASGLAWMIDASHNQKDPLEDLLQSVEAISIAYAQALLVDSKELEEARNNNDVTRCQEILQDAYRTDVRPIVAEARLKAGGALDPVAFFRKMEIRKQLVVERGTATVATGL